jgi:hypothetical protein
VTTHRCSRARKTWQKALISRMSGVESQQDSSGAAIVCKHVASRGFPILQAERSLPLDDVDSGWQFLCNSGLEEKIEEAKVWSINEVLENEPSLREWLALPPGTGVIRKDQHTPWHRYKAEKGRE